MFSGVNGTERNGENLADPVAIEYREERESEKKCKKRGKGNWTSKSQLLASCPSRTKLLLCSWEAKRWRAPTRACIMFEPRRRRRRRRRCRRFDVFVDRAKDLHPPQRPQRTPNLAVIVINNGVRHQSSSLIDLASICCCSWLPKHSVSVLVLD